MSKILRVMMAACASAVLVGTGLAYCAALLTRTASALGIPTAIPSAPSAIFAPAQGRGGSDHLMFGGTVSRNMVNLDDTNIPVQLLALMEKDAEGKDRVAKRSDAVLVWKAGLSSLAYGCPIVADGKIFVGTKNDLARNPRDVAKTADGDKLPIDKGVMTCFDEKTGKFLWQAIHDKLAEGQVNDWPRLGNCCTATAEGNKIYYVSNRCTVVCADVEGFANGNQGIQTEQYKDATDADILWEYDMIRELKVFPHNQAACCPLIFGGNIFIITANGVDENHTKLPSPDAPSFIALNTTTGKLVWKSSLPGKDVMHGQWSNAAYGEFGGMKTVIFPGGDGWLYGLKPDTGELLWKFDANPKDTFYKLGHEGTKNDFIGTPAVAEGRIYIGVGQDPEHFTSVGHFYCIDPAGKSGDISPELFDRTEKLPNGRVRTIGKPNPNSAQDWHYGGNDPRPETSRQRRDFLFGRTMSTACVVDGICYISELQGQLHCLDAKTGKRYWVYDTEGALWGSPYCVDGKVFLATEGGEVYVFKHSKQPKVLDELAIADAKTDRELRDKVKVVRAEVAKEYLLAKMEFDAPVRSTPVVANGVTYVMTENALYAFKKK